ncbi:N-acetylmuramoyl-L-alanine amidase [Candidatus Riflebacteria bacterium]
MNFRKIIFLSLLLFLSAQWLDAFFPHYQKKVLIDAGHGGFDIGAISDFGLKEKDVNLKVGIILSRLLSRMGIQVVLTRDRDTYLSLRDRVDISNKEKPDFFLSIHHNSTIGNRGINRTEIYYKSFDERVSSQIGAFMVRSFDKLFQANDLVLLPGNYFVLRNNTFPAILGEASYLSQCENAKKLESTKTLVKEAELYFRAITNYFKEKPPRITYNLHYANKDSEPVVHGQVLGGFEKNSLIISFGEVPGEVAFKGRDRFECRPAYPLRSGDYKVEISCENLNGIFSPLYSFPISVRKKVARITALFGRNKSINRENGVCLLNFFDNCGPIQDKRPVQVRFPANGQIFEGHCEKGKLIIPINFREPFVRMTLELPGQESLKINLKCSLARDLIYGKVSGDNLPQSSARVKFFGGAFSVVNSKGEFVLIKPRGVLPVLYVSAPNGFKSFKTTLISKSFPLNLVLKSHAKGNFIGKSFTIDWQYSQTPVLFPALLKLQRVSSWLGMTGKFAQDPDFPYTTLETVNRANSTPTQYYIYLKHKTGQQNLSIRHYPKSKNGKKMVGCLKEILKISGYRKSKEDFFGPGSDYQLTNTTAAAVVLEGDYSRYPLKNFAPILLNAIKKSVSK